MTDYDRGAPIDRDEVKRWIRELEAAGWKRVKRHLWRSPSGALLRGPAGAWKAMKEGIT